MKLWLLRHARVQLPSGLCYGASEVEADPVATLQAARRFAPWPASGCQVWVSPRARTQALASAVHGLRPELTPPQIDARLREMDFGHWEMQAWSAIPKAAIDNWTANFAHHRFGGQESAQEVIDRVSRALEHALALKEPEMVWVTHAGVMRALQFLHDSREHCTISSVSEWPAHAPAMGAWMTLEFPD